MARPKGRKNNATLLKEAEISRCLRLCEGHAALEAPRIVAAMAQKAKDGDVAAAKLILDRVYPARRQVDERGQGVSGITINISSTGEVNGQDSTGSASDAESKEQADGAQSFHHEGVEVLAFPGGKEG